MSKSPETAEALMRVGTALRNDARVVVQHLISWTNSPEVKHWLDALQRAYREEPAATCRC